MLNFNELTDFDFKILNYLYNSPNRTATIASIYALFQDDDSTKLRIDQLSTGTLASHGLFFKENTQYICYNFEHYEDDIGISHSKKLDSVYITPLGIKALEEHKNISSKLDKAKLEERCWRSVSVIALIIAILSFLQSLHIIDLSVH